MHSGGSRTHAEPSRTIAVPAANPFLSLLAEIEAQPSVSPDSQRRRRATLESIKGLLSNARYLPKDPESLLAAVLGAFEKSAEKKLDVLDLLNEGTLLKEAASRDLALTLLSNPVLKHLRDSPKAAAKMVAPKDMRKDEEATWIVDQLIQESAQGDFAVMKGRGLTRAPLDPYGKELVPPHRLAVRYDSAKKGYLLHLTQKDGSLVPLSESDVSTASDDGGGIPGIFFNEGKQVVVSLARDFNPATASPLPLAQPTLYFQFRTLGRRLSAETTHKLFGTDIPTDNAPLRSSARVMAKERRSSNAPISPVSEALDLPFIEVELGIGGAATPPRPLDFAWLEGSTKELVVVDEAKAVAYLQKQGPNGTLTLHRYQLRSPQAFGYPGGAVSGSHVILGRTRGDPTGLEESIPAEDHVTRGWILQNAQGEIISLHEARGSTPYRTGSLFDLRIATGDSR